MERTPAVDRYGSPTGSMPIQKFSNEIDHLIARGKCKQAVELAKKEHQRHPTPDTESWVLQAYLARIEQFQEKGMMEDAQTLLAHVRQRFPGQRDHLSRLEIRSAVAGGRVSEVLAALVNPGTTSADRAGIERAIQQYLVDLPGLASCDALPTEHPLRIAACAIGRAFEAVTASQVTDEQIALPEISHRNPLAGWKLLVRALAAFYRHDDTACRRALDAISSQAAVAPLAEILRGMIDGSPPRAGLAGVLLSRVIADDRRLRDVLEQIECALRTTDLNWLTRSIRQAVQACATFRPELLERLRQHISVACSMQEVPIQAVISAMGASRKDAYFWRLMARASEHEGAPVQAALCWERFLRHAVAEGMFPKTSLEAAMLYLRVADLLGPFSLDELRRAREQIGGHEIFAAYYRDQPPEIAALAPHSDKEIAETILSPGWLFERAAAIDPSAATFGRWWSWAESVDLRDRDKEDVARRWHERQPSDPRPLLILSALAERRAR